MLSDMDPDEGLEAARTVPHATSRVCEKESKVSLQFSTCTSCTSCNTIEGLQEMYVRV